MTKPPKGFKASTKRVLSNTFHLTGRTARPHFWWFYLFIFLGSFITAGLDVLLFMRFEPNPFIFRSIFLTVILIPLVTAGIRRFHDLNMTGWWMVVALFPFIGFFIVHYFFLLDGTTGPNKYGPDPLGRTPPQPKKKVRKKKKPENQSAEPPEKPADPKPDPGKSSDAEL